MLLENNLNVNFARISEISHSNRIKKFEDELNRLGSIIILQKVETNHDYWIITLKTSKHIADLSDIIDVLEIDTRDNEIRFTNIDGFIKYIVRINDRNI